jgi:hypothetical protein
MENGKPVIKPYTPFLLDPSARFSLWPSDELQRLDAVFLDLMKTISVSTTLQ